MVSELNLGDSPHDVKDFVVMVMSKAGSASAVHKMATLVS